MKPNELDINQWQELLTEYNSGIRKKFVTPAVMRIEDTPFTSARYAGGMTYSGERYIYFEPRDPSQPANPDGTPCVAWLMVRMDFMLWVAKELKKRTENRNDRRTEKENNRQMQVGAEKEPELPLG